jgi:hypothetical protein
LTCRQKDDEPPAVGLAEVAHLHHSRRRCLPLLARIRVGDHDDGAVGLDDSFGDEGTR